MILQWRLFITIIIGGLVWLPQYSFAESTVYKSTKIQFFQLNYTGEKYKSFSDSLSSMGLEVYGDFGKPWGRVYSKVRGSTTSGTQEFMDNTTARSCTFTFYQGQFEAGFVLVPIPARDQGIRIFLSGGGSLGYNWLSLSSSSTLTNLKPSDSGVSTGYTVGMGIEWSLTKSTATSRNLLTGEITYRSETATLAGQSGFNLGGLAIHAGYGW